MGDFLEPILEEVRSSLPPADTQQSVRSSDPEFQPVQHSKASVVGPSTGLGFESGSYSSWARRNPGLASLCRRLTQRPRIVQVSYVQVLMAGRSAAAGGAGGEISALAGIMAANFERRAAKVGLPGLTAGVEAVIREAGIWITEDEITTLDWFVEDVLLEHKVLVRWTPTRAKHQWRSTTDRLRRRGRGR